MKALRILTKNKTIYGMLFVFLFWYVMHVTIRSGIIPGPIETVTEFIRLIKGNLAIHIGVSLFRIAAAIIISLIIGVPLGLWVGMNKKADAVISPIAYILYPIPKIAFLPVLMLLFGLGNSAKIILIVTIIVFQIMLAARDGVKEIPLELFYSVRSLGLSGIGVYTDVVIPAILPKIFSALRISIGISIAVLFFGENFATSYGIGYFIMNSWSMVDYVGMFAGILALSIMGLGLFWIIDIGERKMCPWMFADK